MIAKSARTFPRPGLPTIPSPLSRGPAPPPAGILLRGAASHSPARLEGKLGHKSFRGLYKEEALSRLRALKRGIPVGFIDEIAREMGMPAADLARSLGLSTRSLTRKRSGQQPLSASEGERALGLARLIGQVEVMVEESGDPTGFRPAQWMKDWLSQELAALGGRRPMDLLDTMVGQSLLAELLTGVQSSTCL